MVILQSIFRSRKAYEKKTALIYIHQFRRDNDLLVGSMINFFFTYSQHCRYFRFQNLEAFNFCQAIVLAKLCLANWLEIHTKKTMDNEYHSA